LSQGGLRQTWKNLVSEGKDAKEFCLAHKISKIDQNNTEQKKKLFIEINRILLKQIEFALLILSK